MTHLLDTGVWVRAVNQPSTLPAAVLRLLQKPRTTFGLAAISIWEVGKKVQIGRLPLPKELPLWFADALAPNLDVLALDEEVVVEARRLPGFPNRDPADELIVATARVHQLTLLTTDRTLRGYAHARIQYFRPLKNPFESR